MSSRQNVIPNTDTDIDTVIPALPEGWWNSRIRRAVLLGLVFGIIGGIIAASYDNIANQLSTGLQLSAQKSDTPTKFEPATREPILIRLILTPRAAERLDIQTAPLREAEVALKRAALAPADPASLKDPPGSLMPTAAEGSRTMQKVVPYSALLYDPNGNTWVYKLSEPLTFVRHQVGVDHIEGDMAVLSDGPATGTSVVTVGAAELYGAELGIGQ